MSNTKEQAEELWDKYSELIEDDSFSFQRVAGTTIMFKHDFEKAVQKYHDSFAAGASLQGNGAGVWVKCSDHLPGYVKHLHEMNRDDIIIRRIDNKTVIKEYFNLYGEKWGLENFEWLDENAVVQGNDERVKELEATAIALILELRKSHNVVLKSLDINWEYKKLLLTLAGISDEFYQTH